MLREVGLEIIAYLQSGGYVMPPLVAATLLLWYAIGYRLAMLKRGSDRSVRALIDRAYRGHEPGQGGIVVRAVRQGIAIKGSKSPHHLRRHLDEAFGKFTRELSHFSVLISSIVATAPILGLLGTVDGMIETFDSLGEMTLFSQSGGIAGGISRALLTTQMGLAVAIPGLIIGRILKRKQEVMERELAQIKDILCSGYVDRGGAA